jgi:DNA-directed RNA polymerase specialized sigma24 family protein
VADAGFLRDRIAYIVATFPPRTRDAWQLAERFDFDHHAVAREMGIAPNTARWHLSQALEQLRAALRRDGYDLPDTPSIGRAYRRGGIDS